MAYTQCYLQLHALTIPVRTSPRHQVVTTKRKRIVCKAEKEDVEEGDATTLSLVSRRSALTALVGGAAAAGTQLSPAHAADALLSPDHAADALLSPDTVDSIFPTIPCEEYPVSFVDNVCSINRRNFPNNFVFGTASSAYQFEGAVAEGGRKPSIWDTFTHLHPEKIKGRRKNGDVTVDQYHRFSDDIKLMNGMNMDAYRLSISWSRILPTGRISGGVNQEGIDYYHRLIDELKSKNIEPYVTIFHWDVPQTLEDDYGGFLSSRIIDDFREYAEVCFENFGNKVKHWITLNEPWTFSVYGYAKGLFAPGRCTTTRDEDCTGGNSGIEPYIVTHNLLLAHAEAVQLYREKFKNSQEGQIGIIHLSHWFEPYSQTREDTDAARRALDFMLGWYMEPVTSGDYPMCMRQLVGERLPTFRKDEIAKLIGSFDFIGLNYYSANYAADARCIQPYAADARCIQPDYRTDARVDYFTKRNGIPIGLPTPADWLYVYPEGITKLLIHLKTQYRNPLIYITENGIGDMIDNLTEVSEAIIDPYRIEYHYRHLRCLLLAMREGVKVKGYFVWSLLDNFEWCDGYEVRFGLIYVDYKDNLKRRPKLSAKWFSDILRNTPHFLPK